jgi:hypothetical protein
MHLSVVEVRLVNCLPTGLGPAAGPDHEILIAACQNLI